MVEHSPKILTSEEKAITDRHTDRLADRQTDTYIQTGSPDKPRSDRKAIGQTGSCFFCFESYVSLILSYVALFVLYLAVPAYTEMSKLVFCLQMMKSSCHY